MSEREKEHKVNPYPTNIEELLKRADELAESAVLGSGSRGMIRDLAAVVRDLQSDFDSFVEHHRATEAENTRLRAENTILLGAINAQDEREHVAGEHCGVSRLEHGCDWPDAVAERVVWFQEENARLRDERDHACRAGLVKLARIGELEQLAEEAEAVCVGIVSKAYGASRSKLQTLLKSLRARKEGKP